MKLYVAFEFSVMLKLYAELEQVVDPVKAPASETVAPVSQAPVRLNVVSADVYGFAWLVIVGAETAVSRIHDSDEVAESTLKTVCFTVKE